MTRRKQITIREARNWTIGSPSRGVRILVRATTVLQRGSFLQDEVARIVFPIKDATAMTHNGRAVSVDADCVEVDERDVELYDDEPRGDDEGPTHAELGA